MNRRTPEGLKDVSEYPNLFAELFARGWTETDLEKVAGWNLLRVLRGAEAVRSLLIIFFTFLNCVLLGGFNGVQVRDQMAVDGVKPFDNWIPQTDLPVESLPCSTGDYSNNTYTNLNNNAGRTEFSFLSFSCLSLVFYSSTLFLGYL